MQLLVVSDSLRSSKAGHKRRGGPVVKTPRAQAGNGHNGQHPEHGNSALYCLSYVSTQTQSWSQSELRSLLESAREKNFRLGITGLLLHRGDSFFQIIEGGQEEVLSLYKEIEEDDRHCRVEVVTEGPIDSREYNDWQMAFIELDGQDLSALPGFSDVMKNTPSGREFLANLSRTKKLAIMFSVME